jgi:hypothetical protein
VHDHTNSVSSSLRSFIIHQVTSSYSLMIWDFTNSAPVTVIGPNDESNPGVEANLDIQWMIMAMAPGAPTTFLVDLRELND